MFSARGTAIRPLALGRLEYFGKRSGKIAPGRAILQWDVARENRLGATVDAAT